MATIHGQLKSDPEGENASAAVLLQEALKDAGELARIEVSIALTELRRDATAVFLATGIVAASVALAAVAIAVLVAAACFALGANLVLTLCATGAVSLLLAGIGALVGFKGVPREAFAKTRESVERDIHEVKERAS